MKITVQTTIGAPIAEVWRAWTTPADICQWNAASDDWHTPRAEIDLRVGGRFCSRMEARDGSMGFDFEGEFTEVVPHERLASRFGDRTLVVEFLPGPQGVTVRETFDAETLHPIEAQREGWQAILDRFARHVQQGAAGASFTPRHLMTTFLNPATLHPPGGAYSHLAVVPGGTELLFISGQVGVRPDGTLPDTLEAQAEQVFANLGALLAARGLGPASLVKITIFVVTGNDMQAVRAARNRFVGEHRPASTAVYVPALVDPAWRVEIEAVAAAASPHPGARA